MSGDALDELRREAIAQLEGTPDAVRALIEGASAASMQTAADGGWSPHDVVAHLLITQRIGALDRIHSMVEQERPFLLNRDENEELARSGYGARTPAELLDEFTERRRADVEWLRTLAPSAWERDGEHSAAGRVTASEMLFHAAHHDLVHLAQLARMLSEWFEPHRGGMRMF
ncbi:MAG: DinB family protein [Dehalococcoidia bacterium]